MYLLKQTVIVMALAAFFTGCGKPNSPDSLTNPDAGPGDGGYKIVARYATPGAAQDVVVRDTLAFLAQGEGGLLIVSIADPANPSLISQIYGGLRGYSTKVALKDSAAYLAAGTLGMNIVDVSDPKNPVVTGSNIGIKPARNFFLMNNFMFAAVSEQGVIIAEISQPLFPDIRGRFTTPGYARGISITPDSTYLLAACGEMGMAVFDISALDIGFEDYPQVGWTDTPGYAESVTLIDNQPLALLAAGTAGLRVVSFEDTSDVHEIGSLDSGGYAKEIFYHNGRVYLSTETRGLHIIDISDPAKPVLLGEVSTRYALGVDANDEYIFVADEEEGLIIIAIP